MMTFGNRRSRVNRGFSAAGAGRRRRGMVLVLLGLLLISLMGVMGLILDLGILLAHSRQLQNVADSAAMAAARDRLAGSSVGQAQATASTFVTAYHGMQAPDPANIRIPPTTGPYAGDVRYVEVVLDQNFATFFAQVLPGMGATQRVTARAVAGYEAVAAGEGVAVLDPDARPGLDVSGQARLVVNGRVVVNSEGGGEDENGYPVNNGNNGVAAAGGQPGSYNGIYANDIRVVGGVDKYQNFKPYVAGNPNPLKAKQLPEPDPLINLPVPTVALGVDARLRGDVSVSNQNVLGINTDSAGQNFIAVGGEPVAGGLHTATAGEVVLHPGIYDQLSVTGGAVYLVPGIYVISAKKNNQTALKLTGGTVTAEGVLFYNTGHNYNPTTGAPDINDKGAKPPVPDGATLGGFTVNASMRFRPIDTKTYNYASLYAGAPAVSSEFDGMLFFQRRRSQQAVDIQGNSAQGVLSGTLYAKWALFKVSGQGTYDAQFVAGSLAVTGQGDITILYTGANKGKANQLFLVE